MRAADRLHARFGQAEVLDLPFLNQFLDGSRHVFYRHIRVDAVLIEQVDRLDLEPLERTLHGLPDVLRPAAQPAAPGRLSLPLRSNPTWWQSPPVCGRRESFADQLFVGERPVYLGGVEECDAAIHRGMEKSGHLLLVFRRAVGKTHPMHPRPMADTSRLLFPSFCFCIVYLRVASLRR